MSWKRRRGGTFRQPVSRPAPLPERALTWWWHPDRFGIQQAPHWFAKKLEEVDPNLVATWSDYHHRWLVWMKKPQVQHPICRGWLLLFVVEGPDKSYAPLDERVLARLYEASARKWGSAKRYFDAVQRELEAAKQAADRQYQDDLIQQGMDVFNHSQISISMRGHSNGSKFSTYLA